MNKILIIGQAPPAVKQTVPYDTTMFYDWLEEIGISKEESLYIFEFEAVYNKFPGYDNNDNHLLPTKNQMEEYWDSTLKYKVEKCKYILCLGNCSKDFIKSKNIDKPIEFLIHPSKRNYGIYIKNKELILNKLKNIING